MKDDHVSLTLSPLETFNVICSGEYNGEELSTNERKVLSALLWDTLLVGGVSSVVMEPVRLALLDKFPDLKLDYNYGEDDEV